MEITFKARQTDVAARFRDLATAKLEKLEKLDQKTIRVDVEVSVERNPRQMRRDRCSSYTLRSFSERPRIQFWLIRVQL